MAIGLNGEVINNNRIKDWESMKDPTMETNTFEFWPAWTIHLPMLLSGIYYALKSRDFGFFAMVNPAMENGGLYQYSKYEVLAQLSDINRPKTIIFDHTISVEQLANDIELAGIAFPLICKPDIGERGKGVEIVGSTDGLAKYLLNCPKGKYLAQSLLTEEEEYGVFYVFDPATKVPKIISLAKKVPLRVIGDGRKSVYLLVKSHPRAKRYLSEIPSQLLQQVPKDNELVKLSRIGNHCRGAIFLDYNYAIDDALAHAFFKICQKVQGFHYGRLDVKVNSLRELWEADKVKVIEINGTNSEAAHIYSPGNGYFKAILTIFKNFRIMYDIAALQSKNGLTKKPFRKLLSNFIAYRETR